VQIYQGGAPQVIKEVFTKALTGKTIPLSKAVKNNRVFWACKIMTNQAGTEYIEGLWSFGRKNVNYPFSLALDIIDENIDTDGIQAFGTAANYFFITHSNDGSIDKTNDTAVYTFTSVYESQVFDFGNPDADKTILSVKVSFRNLISGETLVAKYRTASQTAWTTIGTYSTVDTTSRRFLNIEATGLPFATSNEFEFRLESTGGLEITGLRVSARLNDYAG